jgi:hypothetical protein
MESLIEVRLELRGVSQNENNMEERGTNERDMNTYISTG